MNAHLEALADTGGGSGRPGLWKTRCWPLTGVLGGLALLVVGVLNRQGTAQPAGARVRAVRPIEQVRVGDRVLATNPSGERDDRFGKEVEPRTWRRLELRAPKTDGGFAEVTLLRPAAWLEAQRVVVGGEIEITVPECGIQGRARVLATGPCPPIKPGRGQVVTGTYRHRGARVIDLYVEGLAEPIGTTPNHRFWSADRRAFVRADELKPGEGLLGLGRRTQVVRAEPRPGNADVHNLEVLGEHTYQISTLGLIVHNADPTPEQLMLAEARASITAMISEFLSSLWDNRVTPHLRDPLAAGTKAMSVAYGTIDGRAVSLATSSGAGGMRRNPAPPSWWCEWIPNDQRQLPAANEERSHHSEAKILERLMRTTTPNSTGRVVLATNFNQCGDCAPLAQEFSRARPGIEVVFLETNIGRYRVFLNGNMITPPTMIPC
jgi:hypothetical protein